MWVRVEPGVVLDELNIHLREHELFFGPETSTSNRCMIGGMVGNNACGAHSLIYGSTRDHTLELKGYLSDGSDVHFKSLSRSEFNEKCKREGLEGNIYRNIKSLLSSDENRKKIYNSIKKEEYEEVCKYCFGTGKKCRMESHCIVYEGGFKCEKCNGKGKWDWIDKIKGLRK